jgi:hypothetical protein
MPRYVRVIEKGAFQKCDGLKMADLGKGLEIIGARAFNACSSLHHINIPRGVRCQINSKMGIFILLEVNDFGSQQRCCGD